VKLVAEELRHPTKKVDYDIIVVGGGPAGCTFVRSLITRKSPLRVLLLEKERFPRDKVCGDGLSYHAIPTVRKAFPELASLIPSSSFSDRQTLAYPPGYEFHRKRQMLDVIPRFEFDNALWQATVKAGAETLENAKVTRVLRQEDRICGVEIEDRNGKRELTCRLVVGADGSRSVVRQATGSNADDYLIHALRQYVRGVPDSTEGLIFFFDLEYQGYFWIFPFVRDGERWANLGYGNVTDNRILKERFWNYFHSPQIQKYLGAAQLEGNLTGFPLNMARFKWNGKLTRPLFGPGYLLLGDAAALIHPLSGEGIPFAIDSGAIAAEVLTDDRIPEAKKGAIYEARVLRRIRPVFLSPAAFGAIRLPMLLPRPLSKALVASANFAWKIIRRLRGDGQPGGIESGSRWEVPITLLFAALVLGLFLIALAGFWISHALAASALPSAVSVRAIGFAVIGTSFCLLDATGRYGWSFASAFLVFTLICSAVVELIGLETGAIFGAYHYNAAIPLQLFGALPIVVPFGWFVFSYFSFATADTVLGKNSRPIARAIISTILLVAYDLTSDPNQVYRGVWTYPGGGIYYGVPAQNFLAWALLGFGGMLALQFLRRRKSISLEDEQLVPLPVIAYLAIVFHEAIFATAINKAPIAAAIGLLTVGAIVGAWFCQRRAGQNPPPLSAP